MTSNKPRMILHHVFVSLIVVQMIGFSGFGVRMCATAHTTKVIFVAAFIIAVVVLVSYFMLCRLTRQSTVLRTQPVRFVVRGEHFQLPGEANRVVGFAASRAHQ